MKYAELLAAKIFRLSSMLIIFFNTGTGTMHNCTAHIRFIIDRLPLNSMDDVKCFNFCLVSAQNPFYLFPCVNLMAELTIFFFLPLKGLSHKMDLDLTARKTLFAA